jgi:hypothetical protein
MVWNIIVLVIRNIGPILLDVMLWPYKQAWSFIQWIGGVIWHGIQAIWDGMLSGLKTVGDGIYEAITWPFRAAWDFIKRTWNNTLGKIHFEIPKWIPGIGGNEFAIPKLAKGGIISRPTIAMLGEAGPEAVVPLRRGSGMLGSGRVYNISVSTGIGDPFAIGQAVARALQDYERVAGPRQSGARGGT